MTDKNGKAVVVLTGSKSSGNLCVFGYTEDPYASDVRLSSARCCIYWTKKTGGIFGLATVGPVKGSRVGRMVSSVMLRDVCLVMEATDSAVYEWEGAPVYVGE